MGGALIRVGALNRDYTVLKKVDNMSVPFFLKSVTIDRPVRQEPWKVVDHRHYHYHHCTVNV